MREFWRVIGACAIVMFFYYAIVFVSYLFSKDTAPALALEKYSLMVALREFRKEYTVYPILTDSPIGDVKKQLVASGYLPPAPMPITTPDTILCMAPATACCFV